MQCAFSNITYGDFQGIELIIEKRSQLHGMNTFYTMIKGCILFILLTI